MKTTVRKIASVTAALAMGLGMMIGAPLAMFMGADEDLAKPLGEPTVLTICFDCRESEHNLLALCEGRAAIDAAMEET